MQDPSCEIVDGFRGAERLMTGFVGDDPESGTEESHPDGDGGVDGSSDEVVSGFREVTKRREGRIISKTNRDEKKITQPSTTYKLATNPSVWKLAQTKHPIAIKSWMIY